MARIIFTKEEVEQALPRDSVNDQCGTAAAWQMYSTMDGADDAADFVNHCMVKILTNPEGIPFVPTHDYIDSIAENINNRVYKALKEIHGNGYGFSDTEPRVECCKVISRLIRC